jgi:hypothetical protein
MGMAFVQGSTSGGGQTNSMVAVAARGAGTPVSGSGGERSSPPPPPPQHKQELANWLHRLNCAELPRGLADAGQSWRVYTEAVLSALREAVQQTHTLFPIVLKAPLAFTCAREAEALALLLLAVGCAF